MTCGKAPERAHWLNRTIVDSLHTDQLREHGGLAEIRDRHALESALARERNKWNYGEENDLAVRAAPYGFASFSLIKRPSIELQAMDFDWS